MSSSREEYQQIGFKAPEKKNSMRWFYVFQMFLSFAQNLRFQFLPIYHRKLGATETQMGLLTSVQNVFSSLFSPYWGNQTDNYGRRIFLFLGGLTAFASAIAISMASGPEQVIFAVAINSIGLSMIIPAWAGALADYSEGRPRGGFVGRIGGIGYAYVTLALLTFTVLIPRLPDNEITQYRIIMWISAANFVLVVILSLYFIDLKKGKKNGKKLTVIDPLRDPIFRRFLIVILFWWVWMSLAWSYFPIVVSDVAQATVIQVAILGIVGTISQAYSSFYLSDYIDQMGVRKSLIIGFLPFSLVPLFYAFTTSWELLIIPQIIGGIGIGFGFAAMQTYIIEIAGSDRAGTYQGTYQILWGLVTFGGSFFGGWFLGKLKDHLNDLDQAAKLALIGIFVLRVLSNIVMVLFLPEVNKPGHIQSNHN
ncbi:MAG: Multidrug resistance protein MdtG [Candidatus Heimdallarchaeota archaeon LC_2]|nr:MAG: Multidrug resistance protein MdtG [Candidatus Heimdallarchaeota archaeon LC_2]